MDGVLPYAMGPDVHEWYGPINPAKAIAAGADFFKVRASINIAEDAQFKRNCEVITAPRSFWHFLSKWNDPIHQAELFCDLIEPVRWELRPGVDCETWTDPEGIIPFCEYVKERLGVTPEIYTEYHWWTDNVGGNAAYAAYYLWAARWHDHIPGGLISPWSDGERRIVPWDDWLFWQFSANGNGRGPEFGCGSGDVDLNYFHGDLEDLALEMQKVEFERYGSEPVDPLDEIRETLRAHAQWIEQNKAGLADLRSDMAQGLDNALEAIED